MNNWRIGQEIVCKSGNCTLKEGKVYTISALRKSPCKCGGEEIAVGILDDIEFKYNQCIKCGGRYPVEMYKFYYESRFAPLEYDQQAIEELLKITQPLMK